MNKHNFSHTVSFILLLLVTMFSLGSCKDAEHGIEKAVANTQRKTAVLLVNHGSRSETWRNALLELENRVRDSILGSGKVQGIKTAFMEYTEPSIATRLKEFDNDGYTDVVIIPVFLTVSTHSFDDIPTITGQKTDPKSLETLKIEHIERYKPKANVHLAPLLDFTDVLQKNILRRVQKLSKDSGEEGLVLIAYGDHTYNTEWTALLNKVGGYVQEHTGIKSYSYGWCGHVASYNPDSTTVAIRSVLKDAPKALVVPVLVAHDEMFQVKIIGDGIGKILDSKERVVYVADAILPDRNVEHWIIDIARKYAEDINKPMAQN
jgi:hypothetical protein